MSEEEKKAIKFLEKHIIPYNNENGVIEFFVDEIVLNLIDRLQEELKQEKEKNNKLVNLFEDLLKEN